MQLRTHEPDPDNAGVGKMPFGIYPRRAVPRGAVFYSLRALLRPPGKMEKAMNNTKKHTLTICEAAISVALALVLSYIKIDIGAQGGSLNFTMIPLVLFAVHRGGVKWGIGAGMIFGILKFIFAEGFAITWQSILLDYVLAYGAVGLAGVFHGKKGVHGYLLGALLGSVARFIIHYISGVTIYAEYAGATYLGVSTPSPWIFSLIYNGFYMLFNTIAAVVITPIVGAAVSRIKFRET